MDKALLDCMAYEVVVNVDVFGAWVVFIVLCDRDGRDVVKVDYDGSLECFIVIFLYFYLI